MVSNSTQTNQPISSSKSSLPLSKSSISKPQNLPKLAKWSSVTSETEMPECRVQMMNIPANRCSNCNINEISNDSICSICQSHLNSRKGRNKVSNNLGLGIHGLKPD